MLESIRRNKVALKGPIGTPIGKGFRSVNVTLRQTLDLYANVRPIRSLPGVEPRFEGTDIVIVRENTEDLYAGLELMIMPGVAQSIKLITEKGCTRICEYAFDYAERIGAQARHRRAQGEHHEALGRASPRVLPAGSRSSIRASSRRR